MSEPEFSSARYVSFSRHCFSELSPVCAIVGGVLAQEIIKVQCPLYITLQTLPCKQGGKKIDIPYHYFSILFFFCVQAISAKDRPYHNCFLYDGVRNTGIVEALSP